MGGLRRLIDRLILLLLVVGGAALVLIIGLSVFFRYIVGAALSWPEEVGGIIFVWYTLLGIVILVGSQSHIAFDLADKYASSLLGKAIRALSQAIIMLYGIIMTIWGWKYLQMFPDETSPAAGIDLTWLKAAVPVTGVLVVLYVVLNFFDVMRGSSSSAEKEDAA